MYELLTLIGQIFIMMYIETIISIFIDFEKKPFYKIILNIILYTGMIYLFVQFIVNYFLTELISFFRIMF